MKTTYQPAFILSVIILLLMAVASSGGLFIDGLYQDNYLVTSGWYGNDLATLLLAVPVMAVSLILSKRGSRQAQLVGLGMLFYSLYNYAFYLFGAAFNSLFLVYVSIFTLSIFALIFGIYSLNVKSISEHFKTDTPVKKIGGFMIIVALFLGLFHVAVSMNYVFTGQLPEMIVVLDQSTNLISALDLSLTVSFGLFGAILLWKRRAWGFVVAVIWNVKSAVYLTALSAATVSGFLTGASESVIELALWAPIGVGCLISLVVLLKNMVPVKNEMPEV
ncbi:MAG: hypothetical protein ABR572_12330 [Cryomorphaceae bacterium]